MSVSPVVFSQLKRELDKAHGFGLRPDRNKIAEIVDSALAFTSSISIVSQEECDFYQSLSKKSPVSKDSFETLSEAAEAISRAVDALEKTAEQVERKFQSKNDVEKMEFLTGPEYHGLAAQVADDCETIGQIASRIKNLLFKPVQGSKENPFKDLAAFAQHRKQVSTLYNRVADLSRRHAKAVDRVSSQSLYRTETLRSRFQKTLVNHPYVSGLSAAAAIILPAAYAWCR